VVDYEEGILCERGCCVRARKLPIDDGGDTG
jgi:hypothetical protein